MSEIKKIVFEKNKNMFKKLLEDYDYQMMLVKDEIISFALSEMAKHLNEFANKLQTYDNVVQITIGEDSDYINVLPEMLVEAIDTSDCLYSISQEDASSIIFSDYTCIKISKKDKKSDYLYEILFDKDNTYIIIQNDEDLLLYNWYEDYIIENTFTDLEVDAIFCTMAIAIGSICSKNNDAKKCNVIDIATYKAKKYH